MTYHRTCGKGGTRNSARERHADEYLPNFNKSTTDGFSSPPRRGRKVNNPGKGKGTKDAAAQGRRTKDRYDRMAAGIPPRQTIGERVGARFIGKSGITGRY
ncbi:MAG: hypothetical protein ACR2P1_25650 [Pseudomonadales bacterium]